MSSNGGARRGCRRRGPLPRDRRCSRRTRRSSAARVSVALMPGALLVVSLMRRRLPTGRVSRCPLGGTTSAQRAGPELQPGPARHAAPGRDRDPAARRRREPRGAARQAHAQGALHGRRVGVPRRRRRRRGGRRRQRPPRGRDPRAARGGSDHARRIPRRSSSSRAGSRRRRSQIRFDTHFFLATLPDGQEPGSTARSASTSAGSPRRGARRPTPSGEIVLVFPTIKHLEQLGEFATVAELLELRQRPRGAADRAARRRRRRGRADPAAGRARLLRAPSAACCCAAITWVTALISARCVNACG